MKNIFPILFCLFFAVRLTAQTPIVIQSGNTVKIAPTLDSAVSLAINNDVLYLPSGTFTLTKPLSKKLSLIGTGWRADSSAAMGTTKISNQIQLAPESSGTYCEGIYFQNSVTLSFTAQPQFSLMLVRSRIAAVNSNGTNTIVGNVAINECVIETIRVSTGNYVITNSIIENQISNIASIEPNVTIRNTVILNNTAQSPILLTSADISNCIIFLKQGSTNKLNGNNTLLNLSNTLIVGEENRINVPFSGSGNVRQDQSFINSVFLRPSTTGGFTLEADYHVKTNCNCSDRGVYSGLGLFRATPSVHIVEKTVSPSTNNNFLKFQFKVRTDN